MSETPSRWTPPHVTRWKTDTIALHEALRALHEHCKRVRYLHGKDVIPDALMDEAARVLGEKNGL